MRQVDSASPRLRVNSGTAATASTFADVIKIHRMYMYLRNIVNTITLKPIQKNFID